MSETTQPCTCTGTCRGPEGLGENWRCVMEPTKEEPKCRFCNSPATGKSESPHGGWHFECGTITVANGNVRFRSPLCAGRERSSLRTQLSAAQQAREADNNRNSEKIREQKDELCQMHATRQDLTVRLEAAERERDRYREGYDLSPVSAKACPGCVYEGGRFIRECGLHKRLCDERDRLDKALARLASAEKAERELREALKFTLDYFVRGNPDGIPLVPAERRMAAAIALLAATPEAQSEQREEGKDGE